MSQALAIEASGALATVYTATRPGIAGSVDVLEDGGGAEFDAPAMWSKNRGRPPTVTSGVNVPSKVPRK